MLRAGMRLAFAYMPVKDVQAALALYRDHLGLEESWRHGEDTVVLKVPGTDVELMIDKEVPGDPPGSSPFFLVDSVDDFYERNKGTIEFLVAPKDIPPGRYAAFADPSGNVVRILDYTTEPLPPRR